MPLYEYHCASCDRGFELLRRGAEASKPQPCPACDQESDRKMSQFQAFTMRGGYQRSLPDDGTAWHLGKKVSTPVSQQTLANTHPEMEAKRIPPPSPPTAEEFERHTEAERIIGQERAEEGPGAIRATETPDEQQISTFKKRVRQTAKETKEARRLRPNAERTARTRSGKHDASPKPPAD